MTETTDATCQERIWMHCDSCICGRRVKEGRTDGLCGLHGGAKDRREAKDREREENRQRREEEMKRHARAREQILALTEIELPGGRPSSDQLEQLVEWIRQHV